MDTSSSHLILGLPLCLVVYSFLYSTFFGISVSWILSICPSHRILWHLINLTMFSPLIMASNSSFCLVLHNSFSFTGPYIFRKIWKDHNRKFKIRAKRSSWQKIKFYWFLFCLFTLTKFAYITFIKFLENPHFFSHCLRVSFSEWMTSFLKETKADEAHVSGCTLMRPYSIYRLNIEIIL